VPTPKTCAMCESEVEKTFLLAWLFHLETFKLFGSPNGGGADYFFHSPDSEEVVQIGAFNAPVRQFDVVKAQHKVPPYRLDIVLRRGISDGRRVFESPLVAVEIDGHDFHEKTKEQASRDKERDRVLQTAGYIVLRFTGSEVYRDPQKCVDQVDDCIEEHLARIEIAAREHKGESNA
jgi:very-short-patch-repair endonuclease